MNRNVETLRTDTLPDPEVAAWVAAVALFGVGDIVTTTVAIGRGLPELNPVYSTLFEAVGVLPTLLVLKALGFVALYAVFLSMDRRRGLVPGGVALLGGLIVAVNVAALTGGV